MKGFPVKLGSIHKVIDGSTQAQTILLLNDVANFEFPPMDLNFVKVKASAVALSARLTADASALPQAQEWLRQFVSGYPACEQAAAWIKS